MTLSEHILVVVSYFVIAAAWYFAGYQAGLRRYFEHPDDHCLGSKTFWRDRR